MRNALQLKKAIWAWLLVLWSVSAYAAQSDFAHGMESIDPRAVIYTLFVSFLGGLGATLTKLSQPDAAFRHVWLEVLKDLVCSLGAGMLVFLASSWAGATFWAQAILIFLGGYAGSRLLERAIENGLFPWIDKMFSSRIVTVKPTEETPP